MRTGGIPYAALVIVLAVTILQVSAGDLYWEGEEDSSNEFLEVKPDDNQVMGHLKRFKRDWGFWNPFGSNSNTNDDPSTDSPDDIDKDDDSDNLGSGTSDKSDSEPREKTLRVTFQVMEPYRPGYSDRDSDDFLNISHSLANGVDALFESLTGSQKSSLVRIQSLANDVFSCKVAMDIVTTGYDNTDRIKDILKDHIKNNGRLGDTLVRIDEFSAQVIDPASVTEPDPGTQDQDNNDISNINDKDDQPVAQPPPLNGESDNPEQSPDIYNGGASNSDENPIDTSPNPYDQQPDQSPTNYNPEYDPNNPNPDQYPPSYDPDQNPDDSSQNPDGSWPTRGDMGDINENNPSAPPEDDTPVTTFRSNVGPPESDDEVTTPVQITPEPDVCPVGYLRCDETRCLERSSRCNGLTECYDGTDEAGCPDQTCGGDDFRCGNGMCIERGRVCDKVQDCPNMEDERDCDCSYDEFRCESDGVCIEDRKKCDGTPHCSDGSDEAGCACRPNQWQCDHGSCIMRSKRCDGRVDCPTDRSDERNCIANGYFRCRNGKLIPDHLRCNRQYDCTPDDFSDEQNCPCGATDFKCDNGYCIPAYKHCDRTHDCQDGSDERECIYGTVCMAYEYECSSGMCVQADARCNGTIECDDGTDETSCPCKRDQYPCRDGSCINIAFLCNGREDCSNGEDEYNCHTSCRPDLFTCPTGSPVVCARRCDDNLECEGGEDEENCPGDCDHKCGDGTCIPADKICNMEQDCSDGSDELNCDFCDGPDDFRCESGGECLSISVRCNKVSECPDESDERDCNYTMTADNELCNEYEFQCESSQCINLGFHCDGNPDCDDGSDETNCLCPAADSFQCRNGECIASYKYCDGTVDCGDQSDEADCPRTTTNRPALVQPTPNPFLTTTVRPPPANRYPTGGYSPSGDNGSRYPDSTGQSNYAGRGDSGSRGYPYGSPQPGDNSGYPYGSPQPSDNSGYPYGSPQPSDNSGYPYGSPQPSGSEYDDRQDPNGYPDDRDQDGTNRYPSGNRQPGGSGYPDATGKQGNSVYTDDRNSGYPDERDQDGTDRNPSGNGQSGGSGNPDSRGQQGNSVYPDDRYSGYPDERDQDGTNRNPSGNRQSGGSGYPDATGQQGNSVYPDDRNSGYPDERDQDGTNRYPSGNSQSGGNSYPDDSDQQVPGYPGDRVQPGSSGYPDSGSQLGGGGQPGGSRYPGGRGQPGGNGYSYPNGGDAGSGECSRPNQWRCENGPCIDASRRCNGHIDCPFDFSDEFDCPFNSPIALKLKTYPEDQSVRYVTAGGDVVFQCRDEGPQRATVHWTREGRRIKEGSTDVKGRLEMIGVTEADGGTYICQAVDFIGQPGSETRVKLVVETAPVTFRAPFPACKPYEATCSSGQCVPKSAVCNDKIDCDDGSDEDNCHHQGMCEPNQFKCKNLRCVLKTWVCDSEDDCGDASDEQNCGIREPGKCSPVEHSCLSGDQCIPRSFHCDGQTDCIDGSDEIGCAPIHVVSPPKPSTVRLNPGDTLTLHCKAVGVPVPVISWRLNWGHVPPTCFSTSENGEGVLTCPNILPEHSGAYSCEAINNKATNFAVPDAIVFVNKTDVCPQGYFNSEARSESECIRCFCFARAANCRSADLFTYNMPTPLGEGGTRLVGIKQSPTGDVQLDNQPITGQYHYQPMRNGATVTKNGDYSSWSNSNPYLTLPESYTGNQLKSYGGHIKYTLTPQTRVYGIDDTAPTIIIKGKYGNLFHTSRASGTTSFNVEARITPEDWMKGSPSGYIPAAREDIMMTFNDIEMILLRADLNNAGVDISDFVMESADHINVGLGAANLVEECACPKEYDGLSCQKCASGYVRKKVGPWLGVCAPEDCPPGTYGDPASGLPCQTCPCPLTNRDNQFARTCSLGPDGSVICDCYQGYEGRHCEACAPGYEGNPMIPGNTCKRKTEANCNPVGTKSIRPPDECVCKDNAQGRYCDQCRNNTFYLSSDFRHGCARCFCMGVTDQCMSSNYRRKTINVQFNVPQVVEQVKVYKVTPSNVRSATYTAPLETELKPQLYRGDISLNDIDRSRSTVYYWSMPASFAADKVTAYGGYLRYVLKDVPSSDLRFRTATADVHLISDNSVSFKYFGDFAVSHDGVLNASIQLLEKEWQRPDGKEVQRENFLMGLADVKTILIKATYSPNAPLAVPVTASIEVAEPDGYGPAAFHVEQCVCPTGYKGTSCEDCAPGYTRSETGLYLQNCEPCECNGKSSMCHPENGVCMDCADNTDGDNCEICKPGYRRDPYNNCVPESPSTTRVCTCDVRGTSEPCDESGNCYCKPNVEGPLCDRCRPGTFGLDHANPEGCLSCYCSGVTKDCHEANHYVRWSMPAPVLDVDFGGFTLTDLNAQRVIKDNFLPYFPESKLSYTFGFSPDEDLYWSLPVFAENRVLSYGGILSLRQKFSSETNDVSERGVDVVLDGGDISIYWTNPNVFHSEVSYSYQVPLKEQGWFVLNTVVPATRYNFMQVLRNLKRVLVRATVVRNIYETSIADVSMDTATPNSEPGQPVAKGIEICMCPPGYTGTSCESCNAGYYKDQSGGCRKCNCNGHNCQLDNRNQVVCNCRPPYVGPDCTATGLDTTQTPTTIRPPPESTISVRITSPTLVIKAVGSSVNFTCQAQSRVTRGRLPVIWTKSDGELPLERTQINSLLGLIIINNLQVSDSGQYICATQDGMNTQQATVTLKVPGNELFTPTVEVVPRFKESYEGDRIELECRATGNPTPTIRWQRGNNRPLPLSAQFVDKFMIIENARSEDAGEYRCVGTNAVGSHDRTAMVTIRQRPQWPRESLTVSNNSPTIDQGQSIRITCTGTTNVPAGSIDWIRQDNTLFASNVRSENGVLYIDYATPNDTGVYICQSKSSEAPPIPVLVTVVSQAPDPDDSNYNITVSVDRLRIPTGGSGTIECNPVSGRPLPLVKWSKHGVTSQFSTGSSQRGNTLIIHNAQDEDSGYYVCEGTVEGSAVTNIYVYVEIERRERPVVEIWPQGEQAVPLGGEHILTCRVLGGIPEPDITWSRSGGRPLSSFTQIQPQNVLRFMKIEVNDEGEYTCTARNDAGSVSSSAVIKVRAPPEITITPHNYIKVSNGEPINIECRASGYPEPTVSISLSEQHRVLVPETPGIAALRIASASSRDDGYYECTATSVAGSTTDQFVISVDRGDGGYDSNYPEEGSGDPTDPLYNPDETNPDEIPRNLIALEGAPQTILECVKPGHRVKWLRGDFGSLQLNARQEDTRLIISPVTKSDSGQYVCQVIDAYGDVEEQTYFSLEVGSPPRITLRPPAQTVRPGQSPTVECIVDGDDIIDVTWRPQNRQHSNRVDTRGATLIFHKIEVEDAGQYECIARSRYGNASAIAGVYVSGASDPEQNQHLVQIEQPRRAFRAGDNVDVLCRSRTRDIRVDWFKVGTNQFVETIRYGDGAMLSLQGVTYSDSGLYRCVGTDSQGRTSVDEFQLDVQQGPSHSSYPVDRNQISRYSAALGKTVDMVCPHDLEGAVSYEWKREFSALPAEIRSNQPNLHLEPITEADAGWYVCRVSNSRGAAEARVLLTVTEVVPRFGGESFISLPTLKDAYKQFDIEISFKPADKDGLIFYNSENQGREGDYIALQLRDQIPEFIVDSGLSQPLVVRGNRPLQLNVWHTIRLSRTKSKVTMDVDNIGPFVSEFPDEWEVLELKQPLYIGGVPDYDQLPAELVGATGFVGCVSMLILAREEKNIIMDSYEQVKITPCDTCVPNTCLNEGVCQEARNERGHVCICAPGFAGQTCDRSGEACRPGLCGPGKCTDADTPRGYKCSCPVTHTGTNCEMKQSIEYPAFAGSAYLAIKAPRPSRTLRMSMKINAAAPVTDGIIMYCAESPRGYGGFTSLAVHNRRLEFRYDLGPGTQPVVLVSDRPLAANDWTDVMVARIGPVVSLRINSAHSFEQKLDSPKQDLNFETPIFVGGVDDDSITLNNNTGVVGGFNGCIKDFMLHGEAVDIVNSTVGSANINECIAERGDTPDESCHCLNGGTCTSDFTCVCPLGYTGEVCENRTPSYIGYQPPSNPCDLKPCKNGGTCRRDLNSRMNHTCDCPLGYAGVYCQMGLILDQSVGFNGNGYLELPARLLNYDNLEEDPAIIAMAMHTTVDGVLLYQRETQTAYYGDYLLLRIDRGYVVLEWDLGGGKSSLSVQSVFVNDGERHQIIAKLLRDGQVKLWVDNIPGVGTSNGIATKMNADSNIYLGGMPDNINQQNYPGFTGCIEQLELMTSNRGLNLGHVAVAGRNTQRCKEPSRY